MSCAFIHSCLIGLISLAFSGLPEAIEQAATMINMILADQDVPMATIVARVMKSSKSRGSGGGAGKSSAESRKTAPDSSTPPPNRPRSADGGLFPPTSKAFPEVSVWQKATTANAPPTKSVAAATTVQNAWFRRATSTVVSSAAAAAASTATTAPQRPVSSGGAQMEQGESESRESSAMSSPVKAGAKPKEEQVREHFVS